MPIVTMPDGKLVDMPEKLSPEQAAALTKLLPGAEKPSFLGEAAKIADQTVRGGLTALPRAAAGAESFILKALRGLGSKDESVPVKDRSALQLAGDVISRTVPEGLAGLLDKASSAMEPTKPSTEPGKFIGNVGESIIGTMTGGGPAKLNALIGAGAGIGSEVSARTLGDNAVTRTLGGVIGGGVPALASKVIPNSEKLLRQAVSQVPPQDWRRAAAVEKTLNTEGISHLKSQLLGDKSTLSDLVAVASTHPSVRPSLIAAVENSPEQARNAFKVWESGNMPISVDDTRSVLSNIQDTAASRISALKGQANDAFTAAMPPGTSAAPISLDTVANGAKTLRTLASDPNYFGRLSDGGVFLKGLAGRLETAAKGETPLTVGEVNNLLKTLNTTAEKEGYKGVAVQSAKGVLKDMTPEFTQARQAKYAFMTQHVNPAEKGLTGQLAQMGGGVRPDRFTAKTTALNMVFPADVRQPDAIKELGKQIGGEGVGELLREHLSRSMEKAVRLTGEAGRMQQPFDFVKAIAGTNAQRQNLEAALSTTAEAMGANPTAVRNGFYKLMRAFETTKDLKLPATVDRAVLQQQAGLNLPGLVVAPQSRLGRMLWEKATEKTFKQIADTVMSPEGLKQLELIAKTPGTSPASAYARAILVSTAEASPGQE